MKVIIFNNIKEFDYLTSEIHEAMKVIDDYKSEKYAEPFYSMDGSKIALNVEATGERKAILDGIIKGFDVTEIQNTDPFWFSQEVLKMEI
jgi:mevalonate pyrophosphate decarboxylase